MEKTDCGCLLFDMVPELWTSIILYTAVAFACSPLGAALAIIVLRCLSPGHFQGFSISEKSLK